MIVTGIIAEYNPFHNGHLYHLQQAKELTNADYIVVVMSGDFVQRGEPAILCKEERTAMALQAGADLVLELPVCFATASAELFAKGGVSLLHDLGCINYLCFGSEAKSINELNEAASVLLEEDAFFSETLKNALKQGLTYAAAMEQALSTYHHNLSYILSTPNNLLAIEYLKAIKRLHSSMIPIAIVRKGASYTDCQLSSTSFSSASAIRKEITTYGVTDKLKDTVPSWVFDAMKKQEQQIFPIVSNDFSIPLDYVRLITQSYDQYSDISKELADRMEKRRFQGHSFYELIEELKTKQYTHARISRGLLHLLLGITQQQLSLWNVTPATAPFSNTYAKVLGFRQNATPLLRQIKEQGTVPLVTKPSTQKENEMLQLDLRASHFYHMAIYEKFGKQLPDEYRKKLLIL